VPNWPLLKVKAGVARRLSYFPEDDLEVHQFVWKWELTPEHRAANLATLDTRATALSGSAESARWRAFWCSATDSLSGVYDAAVCN
jgi:hypothetical protein